ncbi:cytochrome-c peroxidase [Pseudorhodoplanes sp.]|uniref:cytochrome-c peroxidase n=1 Tax=Pseudorhodoplanes sp. TaxID=1934341 RepID=UPI00391C055B
MRRSLACLVGLFVALPLGDLAASDARAPDARALDTMVAPDIARMKAEYRRPPLRPPDNPALVALGRDLFFDPVISASGKTACASCHRPELGFAANESRSITDSGRPTQRKTQTLLGIGHARPPFDWDGQHATLEAQGVASIGTGSMSMFATPNEVKVDDIVARLRSDDRYVSKFATALPGRPINLDNVVIALAAFQRSIEPGIAPFDRWVEGDETAISDAAKRGFVLFHTEAACAGCHHGWRFTDDAFHDVGIATKDRGRGAALKHDPRMQFAFKTPTLRSVALRAPYLHDGSAATLRDVIDLYTKGGIDRPSRSPMINPFDLSEQERDDLVAFLHTLTADAVYR